MSHFAKVENGVVTQVIVAEQDFINLGVVGNHSLWIQCSYNGNIRNIYPGPGCTYDPIRDIFIAPQPYSSWKLIKNPVETLNPQTMDIVTTKILWDWRPPKEYPRDGGNYVWDEQSVLWKEVIINPLPTISVDSGSVVITPASGSIV
jgi:hypothetical protein